MVTETSTFDVAVTDACNSTYDLTFTVHLDTTSITIVDTALSVGTEYEGITVLGDTTFTEMLTNVNGCDSLVTTTISTITTSLTENWSKEAIKISPNPANNTLLLETYELPEKEVMIYVRDIYGRQLFNQRLLSDRMPIDLSILKAGHYFIEIRSQEKFAIRRFIKM